MQPILPSHMNRQRYRIAVLDDDADLRKLLRLILEREYAVLMAGNGVELRRLANSGAVDIVLLDIGLPDEDGISIARQIRATSSVPIVFLSGHSSEDMIVKGLNIGGGDYLTKPFQAEVLLARIRNSLRHAREQALPQALPQIRSGDLSFDATRQTLVNRDGRNVKLTEMEAQIFSVLALAGNQPLSRDEIFRRIHGRDWDLLERSLEVHLSRLRKKMAAVSSAENAIIGVRGVGYRLNVIPEDSDGTA